MDFMELENAMASLDEDAVLDMMKQIMYENVEGVQ